jgi:hypothetical protein
MVLECLAITLVFAVTCCAVLMFMRFCGYDPASPMRPTEPRNPQDRHFSDRPSGMSAGPP